VSKTSQFTRSALITVALASLTGAPAMAREADRTVHRAPAVRQPAPRQLPPRVDGMGVQPVRKTRATTPSSVPAVPLTRAATDDSTSAWLLGIGAVALAALTLAAATVRHAGRQLRHPFRAASRV
jgi:hypothetical protein